ncbi:MAG: PEP/pyruvate-binding domain-containing protein, partial [Candidatus Aquicultor sp.]
AQAGFIVRSSATIEDTPKASFAGILSSYPDVHGLEDMTDAVRRCWASIFTPEAHIYLKEQGMLAEQPQQTEKNEQNEQIQQTSQIRQTGIGVAVLTQAMIPAERSGIVFSMDTVTGDTDKVIVDAIFGFGEEIVSGEVTPERYVYSRKRQMIVSRRMGRQTEFTTPTGERKPVFENLRLLPKLSDREVCELATIGIRLEQLFGVPQDIEWAFSEGRFYVLQSRPIVIGERYEKLFPQVGEQTVLLRGVGVSPAVGSGYVHMISPEEVPEVAPNTVIVARRITNDLAVHLRRAAAVVTDEGGATSHGANILREFGVSCVFGTGNATERLREDQVVTVDGFRGVVYEGDLGVIVREISAVPPTETRVFVSILIPEKARSIAPFADGVSSLRDDYFMLESGVHPIKMIEEGLGPYLEDNITNGIIQTLSMFGDKPVWYKTMDAPTDEFRRLKGAEDPEERNPLFGWRGIGRELEEPEMLKLELRAIKRALNKAGGNLGVKLPFIRFVDELIQVKRLMREVGLKPHEDVEVGISVENPAVVFTLDDFIDEGIDFISIGLSDLVMCTLAVDRESQKVAGLFRPDHPAVLRLLGEIASVAGRNGIFTCVAGESARHPEVLPFLIQSKFDAIGVSLSFFADTKREVARLEHEARAEGRHIAGL